MILSIVGLTFLYQFCSSVIKSVNSLLPVASEPTEEGVSFDVKVEDMKEVVIEREEPKRVMHLVITVNKDGRIRSVTRIGDGTIVGGYIYTPSYKEQPIEEVDASTAVEFAYQYFMYDKRDVQYSDVHHYIRLVELGSMNKTEVVKQYNIRETGSKVVLSYVNN